MSLTPFEAAIMLGCNLILYSLKECSLHGGSGVEGHFVTGLAVRDVPHSRSGVQSSRV